MSSTIAILLHHPLGHWLSPPYRARWRTFYDLRKGLTILREPSSPSESDPESLALAALGWVLSGEDRAERLLALTGLTPEILRQGLENRAILAAVLDFLCAHEPDLLAAAQALGQSPAALVAARDRLAA